MPPQTKATCDEVAAQMEGRMVRYKFKRSRNHGNGANADLSGHRDRIRPVKAAAKKRVKTAAPAKPGFER